MQVKTKKTQLEPKEYIKLAFVNLVKSFWWALVIPVVFALGTFIDGDMGWWIGGLVLLVILIGGAIGVLFAITRNEQFAIMFKKVSYQIDSRFFSIMLNAKQGSQIPWAQIQNVEQKGNDFVFYLNRAHLIKIPEKAFNNVNDVKFTKALLEKKGYLK